MSDSSVSTSTHGSVTVVHLDDGKANALSFEVIAALRAAVADAASSSAAMVLVGREGKFSAGFHLPTMTGDPEGARRLLGDGAELGLELFTSPIPVVLGVTGHALAMGGILTTAADYRVGAAGPFKIGLNEVAIGMPVPNFAVGLTRERLSKRWFTRCVQSAELCDPQTAVDAGFLDEVVDPDAVETRAIEVAHALADHVTPAAFRITRETLRADMAADIRAELETDLSFFNVEQ